INVSPGGSLDRFGELVPLLCSLAISIKEFSRVILRVPGRVLGKEHIACSFVLIECVAIASPAFGSDSRRPLRDVLRQRDQITELSVYIRVGFLPLSPENSAKIG